MQHSTRVVHATHVVQIIAGAHVKVLPRGFGLRLLRILYPSRSSRVAKGSIMYRRTSPRILMADVCLRVQRVEVAGGVLVCAMWRWCTRVEAGRELLWSSCRRASTEASRRLRPIAEFSLHRRHRVDCLALCLSVSLHQSTVG